MSSDGEDRIQDEAEQRTRTDSLPAVLAGAPLLEHPQADAADAAGPGQPGSAHAVA